MQAANSRGVRSQIRSVNRARVIGGAMYGSEDREKDKKLKMGTLG